MSDEQSPSVWQNLGIRWLAACAMSLAACASDDAPFRAESSAPALHASEDDSEVKAMAILRNANGNEIGCITFAALGDTTQVEVSVALPDAQPGIRGMHIHANDNPENGDGCIADPMQPPSTHFASADGHYTQPGATHGHHLGDLPALFVMHSGEGSLRFVTDQFDVEEVIGRAVILHESADNYGNIPVGDAVDQYTPNDPAATDLTARTGNAGARYACGVIDG